MLLVVVSALMVFLLLTLCSRFYLLVVAYDNYDIYLHPEKYNSDSNFLSLFDNISLEDGWKNVTYSSYNDENISNIMTSNYSSIIINLMIFLSLIVSSFIAYIMLVIIISLISNNYYQSLKEKIDRYALSLKKDEMSKVSANYLTNRIDQDLMISKRALETILLNIFTIPLSIACLIKIYFVNYLIGIISICFTIFFILFLIFFYVISRLRMKNISLDKSRHESLFYDHIKAFKTNLFFNFNKNISDKMAETCKKEAKVSLSFNSDKLSAYILASIFFYFEIAFSLYYTFNITLYKIAGLLELIILCFVLNFALKFLNDFFFETANFTSSISTIKKIILPSKKVTSSKNRPSKSSVGELSFQNVYFQYPDQKDYILKDLSFDISRGEKVAIIGCSGEGKSTIFKLLRRDYKRDSGEIKIDGIDIDLIEDSKLDLIVSYLDENDFILDASTKENILLNNKNYTDLNYSKACELSLINDDSLFSKNNVNNYLSDGNKKQLQIARSLITGSEIIVLDSIYSKIDYKTANEINKRIISNMKDKTIVYFTNRTDYLKDFDHIIYLEDHQIAFDGNYEEFIEKYGELYFNSTIDKKVKYVF